MNTKTSKIIITIIALAIPSLSYSQIDKASAMLAINKFKVEESSDKLQECVQKIERELSLSDSSRAELYVHVLAASMQYLEKHPKPTETPQINIAPSDNSIAGADPASIKDPVVRAQYEKDITANKALSEAYRKHSAMIAIRDKLVTHCVSFLNINPENKKHLTELFQTASNDPETIKKIVRLIENEEAKRTQQDNR